MSRYEELGKELDSILMKRRSLCGERDGLGMIPERGKEAEWQRLTEEIKEKRLEMRRVRYGSE